MSDYCTLGNQSCQTIVPWGIDHAGYCTMWNQSCQAIVPWVINHVRLLYPGESIMSDYCTVGNQSCQTIVPWGINHVRLLYPGESIMSGYCTLGNRLQLYILFILCPFAVYFVRYGVRLFFTISRIFLVSGTIK